MADKDLKGKMNIPGKIYVDESCIACDACVLTAPDHFAMNEDDGHAYVQKQPTSPEEEDLCQEALEGCPVEAIGDDGGGGDEGDRGDGSAGEGE